MHFFVLDPEKHKQITNSTLEGKDLRGLNNDVAHTPALTPSSKTVLLRDKRHKPASESLFSERLELLAVPLWSFPGLADELLPSLRNEGQMEVCTTVAGKTQSAGDVKIRFTCTNRPVVIKKSISDQTEFGIKRCGVPLHQRSHSLIHLAAFPTCCTILNDVK